jgi:hypothetical protein
MKHVVEDDIFYYNIEISSPVCLTTFDNIISDIYNRPFLQKSGINITDMINGLYFFGADSSLIYKYIGEIINQLTASVEISYDSIELIREFCEIFSVPDETKQKFMARFYYWVEIDEFKERTKDLIKYIPPIYFSGWSSHSPNEIKIAGNSNYIWKNLEFRTFKTSSYDYDDKRQGFWLTCRPVGEAIHNIPGSGIIVDSIQVRVELRIFDGFDIHKRTMTDYGEEIMTLPNEVIYKRYGEVFGSRQDTKFLFPPYVGYEFIITLL